MKKISKFLKPRSEMNWRILAVIAVIVAIFATVSLTSLVMIKVFSESFSKLATENLGGIAHLDSIQAKLWQLRQSLGNYVLQSKADRMKTNEEINLWLEDIEIHKKEVSLILDDAQEKNLLREWDSQFQEYISLRPYYFQLVELGRVEEAQYYLKSTLIQYEIKCFRSLQNLIFSIFGQVSTKKAKLTELGDLAKFFVMTASAVGVILLLLTLYLTLRAFSAHVVELSRQREHLDLALAAGKMGTWDSDLQTRKFNWTSSIKSIYGFEPKSFEESIKEVRRNLHPEDELAFDRQIKAIGKEGPGKPRHMEYRYIHPNGKLKWIRTYVVRVNDPVTGRQSRILGVAADITEQKQAEQVAEERQIQLMAQTKMAALGEIAGGIAHEINNPMAIIDGAIGRIYRVLENQPVDIKAVENYVKVIQETCQRVVRIIDGMKTISRKADEDPLESVELPSLVDDVLSLCRERLSSHNVQLSVGVEGKRLKIYGNKTQLAQVLVNLINNAEDAIKDSSSSKWIKVEVQEHDKVVEIAVSDCGAGIPKTIRERLFTPFFTTKEVGKGTGLGLSLSRKIVEIHGGTINLDDNSPHTKFVVTLPKKAA